MKGKIIFNPDGSRSIITSWVRLSYGLFRLRIQHLETKQFSTIAIKLGKRQ